MKKTKKTNKINYSVYLVLLFVATLFMSVGYAAILITGEVDISAVATAPNDIYISDANIERSVGGSSINTYYQTMFSSTTVLSKTDSSSSVSYSITIYNNTPNTQVFSGITYDPDFYDNQNITYRLGGLSPGDEIKSKTSVTFTLIFRYTNNILKNNNVLNSYLNFNFKKKHLVKYVNITDSAVRYNNYPTAITDGENLNISLNNRHKIETTMGGKPLVMNTDYSFNNNVLNIPNVTDELVITVEAVITPVINENGHYFEGSPAPGRNGSVKSDGWIGDVYNLVFAVNKGAFGGKEDYTYTVKVTNNTEYAWNNLQNIDSIIEEGTGWWDGDPLQGFTTLLSHQNVNPGETLTITFNVKYRTSLFSSAHGQTIIKFNTNGEEKQLELNIMFEQN